MDQPQQPFDPSFVDLALALAPAAEFACDRHRERAALAICPHCRRWHCQACLVWDEVGAELVCAGCLDSERRCRRRHGWLHGLTQPLVFVVLAVVVGFFVYWQQQRRVETAETLARQAAKPWFKRPVGLAWLKQGWRARTRAAMLQAAGQPAAARRWQALAATALAKAERGLGGESRCAMDLRIAQLVALGEAGGVEVALPALRALDEAVPPEQPRRLPYLFHLARLAWLAGDQPAAVKLWQEIVGQTEPASVADLGSLVDNAIGLLETGLHEAAVIRLVWEATDMNPQPPGWRRRAQEALAELPDAAAGPLAPGMTLERF